MEKGGALELDKKNNKEERYKGLKAGKRWKHRRNRD